MLKSTEHFDVQIKGPSHTSHYDASVHFIDTPSAVLMLYGSMVNSFVHLIIRFWLSW